MIQNLGYLEDYLDKYKDPVAHFQQIAKEWNEKQQAPETIAVGLSEKLPDQCLNRKNLGYAIIKLVYAKLQIREFFQNKQRQIPAEYNLNSIFSLLVFNRFLFPSSKRTLLRQKAAFLTVLTSRWMMSTGRLAIFADIHRISKDICMPESPV